MEHAKRPTERHLFRRKWTLTVGVERISDYYNVYCYRVMQLCSTDSKEDDGGSLLDPHTFITTPVRILVLVCHSQAPGAYHGVWSVSYISCDYS